MGDMPTSVQIIEFRRIGQLLHKAHSGSGACGVPWLVVPLGNTELGSWWAHSVAYSKTESQGAEWVSQLHVSRVCTAGLPSRTGPVFSEYFLLLLSCKTRYIRPTPLCLLHQRWKLISPWFLCCKGPLIRNSDFLFIRLTDLSFPVKGSFSNTTKSKQFEAKSLPLLFLVILSEIRKKNWDLFLFFHLSGQ